MRSSVDCLLALLASPTSDYTDTYMAAICVRERVIHHAIRQLMNGHWLAPRSTASIPTRS